LKNTKPVIAIDVDDVLSPFTAGFVDFYNDLRGTSFVFEDFISYGIHEITGEREEDIDGLFENYMASEYFHNSNVPLEGSIEALRLLKHDYQLDIITARYNFAHQMTTDWLKQHFPTTFDGIHFIRDPRTNEAVASKAEICKVIGATILIDDYHKHILIAAEAGIRGLLFGNKPWSRHAELPGNVRRVKDWDEVLEVLL
jgi:5'(3')-deoxyribonucleotidase